MVISNGLKIECICSSVSSLGSVSDDIENKHFSIQKAIATPIISNSQCVYNYVTLTNKNRIRLETITAGCYFGYSYHPPDKRTANKGC